MAEDTETPKVLADSGRASAAKRLLDDPLLTELSHDLRVTRWILLTSFAIGLLTVILIWSFGWVRHGFTAFFWALACFAGGSLVGFLFGIPRVFQKADSDSSKAGVSEAGGRSVGAGYQMVINTHLDDISDWLTKIAVGVGLVELEKIPRLLYHLSSVIAGGMSVPGDVIAIAPFVMALLLYFTTSGFMSGYLTTRMFFQRAFQIADLNALDGKQGYVTETKNLTIQESTSKAANA